MSLDEDLLKLLHKYDGTPNEPFLGEIRRYLHRKFEQAIVPLPDMVIYP